MNEKPSAAPEPEIPDPTPHTSPPNWAHQQGQSALGFFDWLRSLGISREPGWIGGVSAGISSRIGIDVALVRGILVVIAILGFPALFAYGVAWLLLPDTSGKIHLEELLRGNPELPLLGILITLLLGMSAFGRGIWPAFTGFNFTLFGGFWATFWSFSVVAVVIAAVYLISRQFWGPHAPNPQQATFVAPASGAADYSQGTQTAGGEQRTYYPPTPDAGPYGPGASGFLPPLRPEPVGPPAQPLNATPDQMSAWYAQQQAWRAEHAQWKVEQNQHKEAWRRARRAEAQERRRIQQVEQHRRMQEYRARHPRLSGAIVLMIIGAALIIGAVVSIVVSQFTGGIATDITRNSISIGIATSALVFALGMVFAAVFGRKTASLGFLSVLGIFVAMVGSFSSGQLMMSTEVHFNSTDASSAVHRIGVGQIYLDFLNTWMDGVDAHNNVLSIDQGVGGLYLDINNRMSVQIEIEQGIGNFNLSPSPGAENSYTVTEDRGIAFGNQNRAGFGNRYVINIGDPENPEFFITIKQGVGTVNMYITAPDHNPFLDSNPDSSGSEETDPAASDVPYIFREERELIGA